MFCDRRDAGRRLAERLLPLRREDPVVVSLPYGALEVADEVADRLQAPLRLMLARKIGMPEERWRAVSEHGPSTLSAPGVAGGDVEEPVALETVELYRRSSILRRWTPPMAVVRRTVLVVDDGGSDPDVVQAVLRAVRAERPGRIHFVTPIADAARIEAVARYVDDVVLLKTVPGSLRAADHFEAFPPIGDEAVSEILRERGM